MSTAEPRAGCPARRHGDASAYARYRCRCDDARDDWRLYRKRMRAGRHVPRWIDGTGTARRLQALTVIGWGCVELADELGWSETRVQAVRRLKHPRVMVATADNVARAYAKLSMTRGPSAGAARAAMRRGWVPPLAWDDDSIDSPAATPDLGGERARNADDVAAEARHLDRFGVSTPEIARRLGVTEGWIRQLLGGGKRAAA